MVLGSQGSSPCVMWLCIGKIYIFDRKCRLLFRPELLKNSDVLCFLPVSFFAEKKKLFGRQKQIAVEYSSTELSQEKQLILPKVGD